MEKNLVFMAINVESKIMREALACGLYQLGKISHEESAIFELTKEEFVTALVVGDFISFLRGCELLDCDPLELAEYISDYKSNMERS